jgi:hypothetical protein
MSCFADEANAANDGSGEPFDDQSPTLERLEADLLRSQSPSNTTQPSSLEGSLFGEVHLHEIKRLERMLDDCDAQKMQLNQRLQDCQSLLDQKQSELCLQSNRLLAFADAVNALLALCGGDTETEAEVDPNADFPELARLQRALTRQMSDSAAGQLREEVARLQRELTANAAKSALLEEDLRTMSLIAEDIFGNASLTQDDLIGVSE